ncbi:MAG: 6,7-dimethyl-8-ribityllumazine synthase [Bacteroidota bacterium]
MASKLKNLSSCIKNKIPSAAGMSFGIVVSEWNESITGSLYKGAYNTLIRNGTKKSNIKTVKVPGSFELPSGAQYLLECTDVDAVICLGCVIQGETRHFEFICQAVANGISNVGIAYNSPVIFGVLTTNNLKQAKERSGGKHGNKGDEAAITAIKMATLHKNLAERK